MPPRRRLPGRKVVTSKASPLAVQGLLFASNNVANSDVRFGWPAADMIPRDDHTAIWDYMPIQHTGYYMVAGHIYNDGSFHATNYEYLTTPYPGGDGSVNGGGQALDGEGNAGTVHYWEIAGLGASDLLCSPGGTALTVVKDVWYTQVRRCRLIVGGPDDGMYEHTFIPDLIGNPSFVIRQLKSSLDLGLPSAPWFVFGASEWTASGNSNNEATSGVLRSIKLFDTYLSDADAETEALNDSVNAPQTSAGIASANYFNLSPTPTDITDKWGSNDPSWDTASRPTLWEP